MEYIHTYDIKMTLFSDALAKRGTKLENCITLLLTLLLNFDGVDISFVVFVFFVAPGRP